MEYIVSLTDILAWPIFALILLWVVRKPIQSIIPLIQSIKYKNLKVEFSKKLNEVSKYAGKSSEIENHLTLKKTKIYETIKTSPVHGILESWNALENSAIEKVKQLLPEDETFQGPLERPIDYLKFKDTLTPSTADSIHDLRLLKDQASYAPPNAISQTDATQYAMLALNIQKQIDAISELPKAKLRALTLLILEINSLIDSRKYDDITIKEVYGWIERKTVIPSLAKRVEKDASFINNYKADGPYPNFIEFYHDYMQSTYYAYAGDHGRKWGVENSGLCLLLAWTNEIIQQGSGWHPCEV